MIASGAEGFDGFEVITRIDYNERGAKITEYQPWASGSAAGAWNGTGASLYLTRYSNIDALHEIRARE